MNQSNMIYRVFRVFCELFESLSSFLRVSFDYQLKLLATQNITAFFACSMQLNKILLSHFIESYSCLLLSKATKFSCFLIRDGIFPLIYSIIAYSDLRIKYYLSLKFFEKAHRNTSLTFKTFLRNICKILS